MFSQDMTKFTFVTNGIITVVNLIAKGNGIKSPLIVISHNTKWSSH